MLAKSIKSKITYLVLTAGLLAATALTFASSAKAVGEGQIEGGNIYYSRNLTDGTAFGDPTAADKCETLQYKVRLHNPGASPINNVNIKVNLPAGASTQNVSTMTATASDAFPTTRSDTATVNLSESLAISYISGSTELLNSSNAVISSLPDGITEGGVNIGTVGVSLNEIRFVQFKAKTNCPTPPPPVSTGVCKKLDLIVLDKKKREVKATLTGETSNAQIIGYKINFGDNTVVNQQTATHTYAADGTYVVVGHVTIKFADGHTEEKTAQACAKQIRFEKDKPPVITPPPCVDNPNTSNNECAPCVDNPNTTMNECNPTNTITTLADTGPGSVLAIFAGVTTLSSLAYHFVGRRFGL